METDELQPLTNEDRLANLEARSAKLEHLAGIQAHGLSLLGSGVRAHHQIIDATIGLLQKLLGQEPDERLAAELRGAIAEVDELRRLFGAKDPRSQEEN